MDIVVEGLTEDDIIFEAKKSLSGWVVQAKFHLPFYNEIHQSIQMQENILATASLNESGYSYLDLPNQGIRSEKFPYSFTLPNNFTEQLWDILYDFVITNPSNDISWITKDLLCSFPLRKKIKVLEFFLENHDLKDLEFYFWDENVLVFDQIMKDHQTVLEMISYVLNYRKEKSVKRAYINSYKESMSKNYYDPKADLVFARMIKDPNHLVKLIQIRPEIKNKLFDPIEELDIYAFFDFLKAKFTDQSIVKLFQNITNEDLANHYLRDTIKMYKHSIRARENVKLKENIKCLHNELIRFSREEEKKLESLRELQSKYIEFKYNLSHINAQIELGTLSFKLPMNNNQLGFWSNELNNCMFSYVTDIQKGLSTIYGVYKNQNLKYAVEIQFGKIVQALGASNKSIDEDDMQIIEQWFDRVYLNQHIYKK